MRVSHFFKPFLTTCVLLAIVWLLKVPLRTQLTDPLAVDITSYERESLPQGAVRVVIDHVSDGDTLALTDSRRVRLLDIDTPEIAHPEQRIREECYSRDAQTRLRQLTEKREVYLVKDREDTDKYGRLLRHVFVRNEGSPVMYLHVNAYLVGEGYARAYVLDPKSNFRDLLVSLQDQARAKKRGLWGLCDREKFRW